MIDWEMFKIPFEESEIEWRVQRSGLKDSNPWALVVPFVTNRAIMERLDDIAGPANWKNEFRTGPSGGVLCGISIRIDNEWLTRYDGAENTKIEPVKGGLSDAMKRAAVQYGIGRYLYKLDPLFADIKSDGKKRDVIKANAKKGIPNDVYFRWNPPQLPEWALPKKRSFYDNLKEIQEIKKDLDENEYYMIIDSCGAKHANKLTPDKMILALEWAKKSQARNERYLQTLVELRSSVSETDFIGILGKHGLNSDIYQDCKDKDLQVAIVTDLQECKKNIDKQKPLN